MKTALAVVIVCLALGFAQAVHPLSKLKKTVLLEKKHKTKGKLLPHPYRRHRPGGSVESKKTPGKSCSQLTTCQECASVHICVWTNVDGNNVCLDDSDRNSVYGTRESCEGEPDNGYRDVKDVRSLKIEENKNMVAEADTFASNTLKGEKVVVEAITDPDTKSPFEGLHSELREKEPAWAAGAKRSTEVYHFAPLDRTVTRKTFSHTKTTGGKEKPATGEADALGAETPEEQADAKAAEGEDEAEAPAEEEEAAEEESFIEKDSKKKKHKDDNDDGEVTQANNDENEGVTLESLSEKVDKLADAFDSRLSALEGKNDETVEEAQDAVDEAKDAASDAKDEAEEAAEEAEEATEDAEDAKDEAKEAKEEAKENEESNDKKDEKPSMKPVEDLNNNVGGGPGEAQPEELADDMEDPQPIVKQTTVSTMLVKDGKVVSTPTVEQTVEELDEGTLDPEVKDGAGEPEVETSCGGDNSKAC